MVQEFQRLSISCCRSTLRSRFCSTITEWEHAIILALQACQVALLSGATPKILGCIALAVEANQCDPAAYKEMQLAFFWHIPIAPLHIPVLVTEREKH